MTVPPPTPEDGPDIPVREYDDVLADLLTIEGSIPAAKRFIRQRGLAAAERRIQSYFLGGAWRDA